MGKFNTALVLEGLTAYAIERQNGFERQRQDGIPSWMEQRRFWTDAILLGMARLDGEEPGPGLMERFDHALKQARSSAAVPAPLKLQRDTIRTLRNFVSTLEDTGDDRRRQVDVVWKLLEDMASHLPWACGNNGLDQARGQAEQALRRMTARMPIHFTRVLLGGDAGPHWVSGYASGSVTDEEGLRQTAIYREAVRDYPEVKSWPALCTVYTGGGQYGPAICVPASNFDLEIINRAGDDFLKEQGVRWSCGTYQMTVPSAQVAAVPVAAQAEEMNPLLQGGRPLAPDDLAIFERYAVEGSQLTFCLDFLADEKAVFGRQLSDEREGSYIVPYIVYDEDAGAVQDTMDVELRLPHDEKWFHCKLPPEVRVALKEKLDEFCVGLYGKHLPGMLLPRQEDIDPPRMGPTM